MQGRSGLSWKQLANTVNKTYGKGTWKKQTNSWTKRKERRMKNQTNIVKGTWQTLFVVEFVCFYFLQSDSSVCSDIRGIRKRHPFSYAAQLTWIDQWVIYSAACHVSYPVTLSYFKRWNLVSCVYIERISYVRRFSSNRRGTAYVYVY